MDPLEGCVRGEMKDCNGTPQRALDGTPCFLCQGLSDVLIAFFAVDCCEQNMAIRTVSSTCDGFYTKAIRRLELNHSSLNYTITEKSGTKALDALILYMNT